MKDSEEFYKKLNAQLADTALWPTTYLYKFIVPTEDDKIQQIEGIESIRLNFEKQPTAL